MQLRPTWQNRPSSWASTKTSLRLRSRLAVVAMGVGRPVGLGDRLAGDAADQVRQLHELHSPTFSILVRS